MPLRVFALPGNEILAQGYSRGIGSTLEGWIWRRFPDGESYIRIASDVSGETALVLAQLKNPDEQLAPMIFLASTLRDLGARCIVLIAPYLPYMRQDTRFHSGEGITSRYFARLISSHFDGLITVDPHLHRYTSLAEIYTVPSRVGHASALLAQWVRDRVDRPLIVGPDSESEQWVREVARGSDAPYIVSRKTRKADREVEIEMPELDRWRDRQPVLIDDIVSSGATMRITVQQLHAAGFTGICCVAVHPIFAGNAYQELLDAGADQVATTNSLPHPSNRIDLAGLLAEETRRLLHDIEGDR